MVMIRHSQYFTEKLFAESMIALIDIEKVHYALDLGIGNGALSKAVLKRWPQTCIDAIDVDYDICNSEILKKCNINIQQGDILNVEDLNLLKNEYDLAICNPPYKRIKHENKYRELFIDANLNECNEQKCISADVVFIAVNLKLLKSNGILAIIVPDGLLTRKDYKPFRHAIISRHRIIHIIQLPEKAFSKTEARTHIIIIKKNGKTNDNVPISYMSQNGIINETINIDKNVLFNRMDFSYCKWFKLSSEEQFSQIDNIVYEIKRGGISYKKLRTSNLNYLHSNSYSNNACLQLPSYEYTINKTTARAGDIIICRVGKRCVGKIAFIESGTILLSDCLFKITVPFKYQKDVFKELQSFESKEWISINAHGVCSKVISKSDLEQYIEVILKKIINN